MTDPEDRPRLLVLRALGLGDLCTGVPALRGLRGAYPDHLVVLAGPAILEPLIRLSGAVDEVLDVTGLGQSSLPVAAHRADIAVNLHGCGPQSSALLASSEPGRLVAFAHPTVPATADGPEWDSDEHEVRRWCRLVASAGAGADPTDVRFPLPPASRSTSTGETADRSADGSGPGVVIHPGAASAARRWPPGRWAAVVRALLDQGRQVTITGSPGEVELAERILEQAGPRRDHRCTMAAGRTDIVEMARLVATADLVIAGDTGVAHLATAFVTPSVLLFGPTSPARWGPVTDGPHTILWAGRTGDPHGAIPDPGLLEVTVADVLAGVVERSTASACGCGAGGCRHSANGRSASG